MAEMEGNSGVGGATPPQMGSYADDEAAMKSGKGRMLTGIIGISLIVVVGAVLLLMQGGKSEEYSEAGKTVNGPGIKGNFDTFWGCALQGVNLRDLTGAEELIAQVDMRGSERKADYGKYVREICMPKLTDMQAKLDLLSLPSDLQTDGAGLKEASGQLRASWSAYAGYLMEAKDSYNADDARIKIKEVARGWYEFKKAHASLNQKLKEKLE